MRGHDDLTQTQYDCDSRCAAHSRCFEASQRSLRRCVQHEGTPMMATPAETGQSQWTIQRYTLLTSASKEHGQLVVVASVHIETDLLDKVGHGCDARPDTSLSELCSGSQSRHSRAVELPCYAVL